MLREIKIHQNIEREREREKIMQKMEKSGKFIVRGKE